MSRVSMISMKMLVTYLLQCQVLCCTTAPPTMGPKVGPPATAMAYLTIARPRWSAEKIMSLRNPPGICGRGAAKKPAKNRVIITVWISLATAVPNE